ncbi:hypothetical protein D910_04831 [Dendroctonus ponderosae]|uniref:DUF4817 domain-containing protein n=1 Tax=Dendroctonus ponderosae TaxID=77166 RepID=U4U0Q7_DENPD|nr:hypothetical protein D910_04831 [Dendroctonus ponderosae]
MKNCPREERIDMIFTLRESHKNCLLASRVYVQKFPERNDPKPTVFKRLLHQFEETGSVNYKKNPNVGQNLISKSTNISQSLLIVFPELSKSFHPYNNNFYHYKIQLCQELDGNDFENRTEFCMWVLDKVAENENFFENVLFSDECTFHNNGLVNRHNFDYYSDTNSRAYRVMKNENRTSKWFDVSPVSNKPSLNIVRKKKFLSMELRLISTANRWLGRNGFQNWPPRSPDLTPLDFFLWGYIKGIVYHTLLTTSHDMKTRIRDAFKTVTPQMSSRVSSGFEQRIYKYLEMDGQHFEHLL